MCAEQKEKSVKYDVALASTAAANAAVCHRCPSVSTTRTVQALVALQPAPQLSCIVRRMSRTIFCSFEHLLNTAPTSRR